MEPGKFAFRVLGAVARTQAIIIVPGWWKVIWWLNRLSPWLGECLARKCLAGTKQGLEDVAAPS